MSDKKLLEEQVVRRFMKLANIEKLSEGFVKENGKVLKENMDMGSEMPPAEMDEADELVDDSVGGSDKEQMFKDIAQAIAGVLNVDISMDGEGGGEEMSDMGDLEMDGGDHEEPDEDNMGGPSDEDEDNADDMGDDEDDEGSKDEEELDEEQEELDEEKEEKEKKNKEEEEEGESQNESIAEAVLARVKARLLAEAKAAQMKKMKKEEVAPKGKGKIQAQKAMKEASKGGKKPSTGKASSVNWGLKGNKNVGNVAKSKAKKGNLTPAKKSTKHMR